MDTLARMKRLEVLGFERPQAEGLVQMVKQSIDDEVAKKVDIEKLDARIDRVETKLCGDIEKLDLKFSGELIRLESRITSEFNKEIHKIDKTIGKLESKIDKQPLKLLVWLGSLMISLVALLFAAIVFVEPIREKLGVKDKAPVSEVVKPHATP